MTSQDFRHGDEEKKNKNHLRGGTATSSARLSVCPFTLQSVDLSVHPSICPCTCLSVRPVRHSFRPSLSVSLRPSPCMSILWPFHLSARPPDHLSVSLSVRPSVRPSARSVRPSVPPSVPPFVPLSVCSSASLSTRLSFCPFVHPSTHPRVCRKKCRPSKVHVSLLTTLK